VVSAVKFDQRQRRNLRLNALLSLAGTFVIAALLAWLSVQYPFRFDATKDARNSLSQTSRSVLTQLSGPVTITAYAHLQSTKRSTISSLVERYRRHKEDLELEFRNPDAVPDELRSRGISVDGELVVHYGGRDEHVTRVNEQEISNALQRLGRAEGQWLVFLDGHGERRPFGGANHDIGTWGTRVETLGYKLQSLNLGKAAAVPDNAAVLIIASPQLPVLPDEAEMIVRHVQSGGNLLWLKEPGVEDGLEPLADALGVSFLPGIVIDPASRRFSNAHATFAIVAEYAAHASTEGFRATTMFPRASAVEIADDSRFVAHPILETGHSAWSETGMLEGEVTLDDHDTAGPLVLGLSLTRPRGTDDQQQKGEQRIVVIGDGDFLSNTYVGNSGNANLGVRLATWLAKDDNYLQISANTASAKFELKEATGMVLALGFLLFMPLGLAGCGTLIWWRRRRA